MNLREIFSYEISSSAFQKIDGQLNIIGKWCRLTQDSASVFDVWICNSNDLYLGLGQRKLRNIISSLNSSTGEPFHELTGEAWGKVRDREVILRNLSLLGIKKKRRISEKQRKILTERLKVSKPAVR